MMVNDFKYNEPKVNKTTRIGEESEIDIKDIKNNSSQLQSQETHCGSLPYWGNQSIDHYPAHKKNR